MSLFQKTKTKDIDDKKPDKKEALADIVKQDSKDKRQKNKSMKELYVEAGNFDKKDKAGRGKKFSESYRVLVKPLITEKAANFGKLNKYAFAIDVRANKIMVARAIEDIYGVKPLSVNIVNVRGKIKRTGRFFGQRKNWRKAIISLPKGKSIQVYEGV